MIDILNYFSLSCKKNLFGRLILLIRGLNLAITVNSKMKKLDQDVQNSNLSIRNSSTRKIPNDKIKLDNLNKVLTSKELQMNKKPINRMGKIKSKNRSQLGTSIYSLESNNKQIGSNNTNTNNKANQNNFKTTTCTPTMTTRPVNKPISELNETELEKEAIKLILMETERAKERADTLGAIGWSNRKITRVNKKFLRNTIQDTLSLNKRLYK